MKKKFIIGYIILASIILAMSIILKDGIMCFGYSTEVCHKCIGNEYYGL